MQGPNRTGYRYSGNRSVGNKLTVLMYREHPYREQASRGKSPERNLEQELALSKGLI
jgi:hypothetical protein